MRYYIYQQAKGYIHAISLGQIQTGQKRERVFNSHGIRGLVATSTRLRFCPFVWFLCLLEHSSVYLL